MNDYSDKHNKLGKLFKIWYSDTNFIHFHLLLHYTISNFLQYLSLLLLSSVHLFIFFLVVVKVS